MLRDKKVQNGVIRWVLPDAIGHAAVGVEIDSARVAEVMHGLASPSP